MRPNHLHEADIVEMCARFGRALDQAWGSLRGVAVAAE